MAKSASKKKTKRPTPKKAATPRKKRKPAALASEIHIAWPEELPVAPKRSWILRVKDFFSDLYNDPLET